MTSEKIALPGIDADAVSTWFGRHVTGAEGPLHFELIAGGRSNLTYRVRDRAGGDWVLRRPPTGELLASAHDVVRESRVLEAIGSSPVPVPRVVGCCTDPAVTGADFYVMDYVAGVVVDGAATAAEIDWDARQVASTDIVDTLAAIHAVDTTTGPLAEYQRPGSYLERQLKRWSRQLAAGGITSGPLLELRDILTREMPVQRWTGLVHGDYRPGNLIIGPSDGRVRAVLDWELWTVGDVLADVGWLAAMWASADVVGWSPDPADGFLDVDTACARYADTTGRDLSALRYYHAFALWKLAAIAEGVYARFRDGAMGEQPPDLVTLLAQRPGLLAERARRTLAD
ncbi:phosphotransferase family protein [Aldersonia sp. NBC_00410]|uniref:phosphotransferase family protein n=1 Tax=Aldersonia sp. NBC_00410 TaxID=2975954 RepID=UPI00225B551B|nr:phosphotransferase family protein [Aldersonia sp. NBC_00410]MCX5043193.1 phosphotransferase family protein [Aldersonia sp. NBC_00410]